MYKGPKLVIRHTEKSLEHGIPAVLRLLLGYYLDLSSQHRLSTLSFVVPGPLPLSLNHQKKRIMTPVMKGGSVVRGPGGKVLLRPSEALKPEVHEYRARVSRVIDEARRKAWRPLGVTAAIVLFESPTWLTQEKRVRKEDCDNKIKPALDAAALATGVPDELHWQVHAFKIPSKKTRTIVYLFDLGNVIDYYE
jgi:Holliday junction resolvase RusA-like endonuclease